MPTPNFEEYTAITSVVNDLFVATDNRDWAAVENCFAEQVAFDMTSLAGGEPKTLTPKQIAEGWKTGLAEIKTIHHQTGNFRVDSDGSRATLFCYGTAHHSFPDSQARSPRSFVGSYDFELKRINGVWKITLIRFNCKFVHGGMTVLELAQKMFRNLGGSLENILQAKSENQAYRLKKLTPMLETRDFAGTMKFYTETLGFSLVDRFEDSWGCLQRDGVEIMFSLPNEHRNMPESIMSGSLYFNTDKVDAVWAELKDKAKVCYPIENFHYGMREFAIFDNNGYLLQFGQPIKTLEK